MGEHAVGKLLAGDDPLRPRVSVFVDEEAGVDVTDKVQRRLQHFIDRKINALFEPLMASKMTKLDGSCPRICIQLVEALGILNRADVADEVKALDQDARSMLRKHGIRFGQLPFSCRCC